MFVTGESCEIYLVDLFMNEQYDEDKSQCNPGSIKRCHNILAGFFLTGPVPRLSEQLIVKDIFF